MLKWYMYRSLSNFGWCWLTILPATKKSSAKKLNRAPLDRTQVVESGPSSVIDGGRPVDPFPAT